jgi:hypothetical protein
MSNSKIVISNLKFLYPNSKLNEGVNDLGPVELGSENLSGQEGGPRSPLVGK